MEKEKKTFISWPVLALMSFVTVIGFDDIVYNFQNQGMGVITSWIILLLLYVIPYSLMVGQLGSVFNSEGGGLSSWVRGTRGEKLGYFTAWTYWAASIPYVVDTANAVVVGFGWLLNGSNALEDSLSTAMFALITLIIFVSFIFIQRFFKGSLEFLGLVGGGAMFILTILYVFMAFGSLLTPSGHIATTNMSWRTLIPKFDLHYFTTIGLLIYAINGAELIAPFVTKMKRPKKDFPKAMIMLTVMTIFLTVFGSFALGIFFNAHNIPNDFKMNGSYYAFLRLGDQFHMGSWLMYAFAVTQIVYMCALLAVLLDAMTRMLISDTGARYMPKKLLKVNKDGLPINGYILTCTLSAFILFLGVFLPDMNTIFNWLLNLNGIISPGVTCWIFFAFMQIRKNSDKYPSEYVFIKNDKLAYAVGLWCLVVTVLATIFGIIPQDVAMGSSLFYYQLAINIISIVVLIGLGFIMPMIAERERKRDGIKD
ncbi:APC family permease [Dellaglioa algida]|uniref:Amino acid permease n=1 Tax=Dellaglioa algida TaxID=105612 RepID=A0A2C8ETD6_9LACO|nr:amino acid permease [Dellaglioa algida]MDK1717576.1 amino acid permease [Dellaglioa algida]MDK1719070.1 amino acid permease [Dellaglioa algida]MDK1720841.1 amino acid permease [Dellaglioa algida]MDK1722518.1 amino acid permease [Dellaglioa algida]MDK1724134.1 amino acid permease [Dellaglioa algida]